MEKKTTKSFDELEEIKHQNNNIVSVLNKLESEYDSKFNSKLNCLIEQTIKENEKDLNKISDKLNKNYNQIDQEDKNKIFNLIKEKINK